jgi:hypothetical protein
VIDHVVTAYNGIESIGQVGFEDAASGDKEFMVATAVTPHFPVLKGLVASPSLHLAAAAMLGSPLDHVCIWIDKIFNKNGGDLSTHWHTDGQANRMPHWLNGLTAWVPFQNTSKDNGLLRYVSQQVSLEATVNTGEKGERQASAGDPTEDEMADVEFMEVGDVAFHHLNTRHGSFPNPSNDTRAALSVMFVAMPTKSNGGHNDKDSDNEPQFCTQHPNCGFATLTRVLSGAAELCRTCDFAFNDTKKHLLMYDQLSMAEEELDTCVDDVFALCRQVFNLISQKDNLVWLDSALQNCAQLKALSLPNPGQSRDPLPLPKSRIRSHLSMYTASEMTGTQKDFAVFKMIYEESNFGEDNLLSLEEFLEAPLVKTDDIINAWNLWSVMQAAGMSELLDIDVPTDMTDFAAGQVSGLPDMMPPGGDGGGLAGPRDAPGPPPGNPGSPPGADAAVLPSSAGPPGLGSNSNNNMPAGTGSKNPASMPSMADIASIDMPNLLIGEALKNELAHVFQTQDANGDDFLNESEFRNLPFLQNTTFLKSLIAARPTKMSRGNPGEQGAQGGSEECNSDVKMLTGLEDREDDEPAHWVPPPVPPQAPTTIGTGPAAEPFKIFHPEHIGRILSNMPVTPSSLSRPELCCATTYSAIWDPQGKLYAAVVDRVFCESHFERIQHSVLRTWAWEDASAANDRLGRHNFEGNPNNWAAPLSDDPMGQLRWNGSPSLLGHAVHRKEEQKILLELRDCLQHSLPPAVFEAFDPYSMGADVTEKEAELPLYRDPVPSPFPPPPRRHYGTKLIPLGSQASAAHLLPKDLLPFQSAPRVGASHLSTEFTLTSNRAYEATGTVFVKQRASSVEKARTREGIDIFNAVNEELHRDMVLDGGSMLAGWTNATETRWGDSLFMVPNAANRVVLYPSWRPHGAWIPETHLLSNAVRNGGRFVLDAAWMMHTTGKKSRTLFCQSRAAGNPMQTAQDAVDACMRCSAWRDCAWYPQSNSCQPSSCVYGRRAVTEKKPKRSRGDPFSCREAIGVDAEGLPTCEAAAKKWFSKMK